MRKARAWPVGVMIAVLAWPMAPVAQAEEPLDVETPVTDLVDAVGDDPDRVRTAIDRLTTEHGLQLYVVYVDDFSGWDAQEWADETATRNELTARDAVLAVATEERGYALSIDPEFPVTSREANQIKTVAIEPALRASDWAAAAVAAANAIGDVRTGNTVQPPDLSAPTPPPADDAVADGDVWVLAGGAAAVVVLAAAAAWWMLRGRTSRPGPDQEPGRG